MPRAVSASPHNNSALRTRFGAFFITLLMLLIASGHAWAQQSGIRFQFNVIRVTVPVGVTTNVTIVDNPNTNNTVVLVAGATNANFDISGLPAGVTANLVDTNNNPLVYTTQSTNLCIQLGIPNTLAEGVYVFNLNAGGFDTNGLPVTNSFPFVIQSAHIWKGNGPGSVSFSVSNNWSAAASWYGGIPTSTSDVVIGDSGAQTNLFSNGTTFTNIGINSSVTINSLRFAQTAFTNSTVTNTEYHTIGLTAGSTLSITGALSFSLLRDYIGEFNYSPISTMGVAFVGTNATLLVSNATGNFGVLVDAGVQPTLTMSNLSTFVAYVNHFGVSDYLLYPNYRALNAGFNGGRDTTNYAGLPRRFWSTMSLARTNVITALYQDPNNYTNEFTRSYGVMLQNNEQTGNGSSVNTFFWLGVTNAFFADSVCFIGANSASGNGGGTKFWQNKLSSAIFRGTNGGRMSVFTISDGGGTNQASSNVKATVDFTGNTNYVDILADRFYIARDRTMIASNQTPNVQGDLIAGYSSIDVNTAVLGFQEHSNKIAWTNDSNAAVNYLNYCQGRLTVTNGGNTRAGLFKVNGNLTLGFTADMNSSGAAQQYNTYGRITIYSNATVTASNIIVDGGLNYYDGNGRQNTITVNQGGTLIVSNTIGSPNYGASDFTAADPRGMALDNLTIAGGGTITLNLDPSRTNVFVRTILTPGLIPGVIRVAKLTGVSSYPVQLPVISYTGTAAPFLNADVSPLGAGYYGYLLNNAANNTIDVYITTNAPNNLLWTGSTGNNTWDTSSPNWVPIGGGNPTNFNLGDLVTFNDSSTYTNINISGSVVPGQTGVGVTISNSVRQYTFSGGTVAGTALVVKQGTNVLEFDATEQGPINVAAGSLVGSGGLGAITLFTNTVLNYSGNNNGGLTSTGIVMLASSAVLNGPVSVQGGYIDNFGKINTTAGQVFNVANGALTNELNATINAGSGPGASGSFTCLVSAGTTLANFGTINLYQPKLQVEGLLFGNGSIYDPNSGGLESIANGNASRVLINPGGTMGIGPTPSGTVGTVNLGCRFDFNNDPTGSPFGISTILVDFDFANPQTNDIINCDRWNNDTGLLLFTNINPTAGGFTNGQVFSIIANSSGSGSNNYVDTTGFSPFIQPYVPGPGLVWGTTNFNSMGLISVMTNSLIWDGVTSANWSTNLPVDASWKAAQTYQDNMGAYFDDTASGSTTVNINSIVAPAGVRGSILNSNQPAVFPGIIVTNATKNYVFTGSGKITGITGIYKTGSGTLTLLTTNANDYSGNTIIEGGTLEVTNQPPNIGGANIVSLGGTTYGQMKNEVVMDGGTLSYIGTTNVQLNHHVVVMSHNGGVNVASSTNTFTINNNVVGAGGITKTGPGTLALLSANNNYAGGTLVNAGTLRLNAAGAASFGTISFANNTALDVTNNFTLSNALSFAGSATAINILGSSTNVLYGAWAGSASVTFSNVNPLVFNGDLSGFSGSISFGTNSANYRFNNSTNGNPCTGSAAAAFDLGTGSTTVSNLNGGGITYNLGALSGGPLTTLAGRFTNGVAWPNGTTYSIGARNNNTTFSGRIIDGVDSVSVVKVGTGTLLLNGTNTYSGTTTVSNGVFGGSGSIASALTLNTNATLSPGASIGTFTVSNNATLNGTILMELDRSNPATNDALIITGTISGNGSLVVTNVGPDLYNGSTFHLFNKAVTGFTVVLPATGPFLTNTYTWQNDLAVDGSIKLVSGGTTFVNTNSTNITTTVSGNTLTLSWPADHIGWQLLSNSVSLTATNMWFPIAGSTQTNQETITLNPQATNVFYRMIYPPLP